MAEWHSLGRVAAPRPCPSRPAPVATARPTSRTVERAAERTAGDRRALERRRDRSVRELERRHDGHVVAAAGRPGPGQMTAVSTTPKRGFETTIPRRTRPTAIARPAPRASRPAPWYVEVRALSASGKALATSKATQPTVE